MKKYVAMHRNQREFDRTLAPYESLKESLTDFIQEAARLQVEISSLETVGKILGYKSFRDYLAATRIPNGLEISGVPVSRHKVIEMADLPDTGRIDAVANNIRHYLRKLSFSDFTIEDGKVLVKQSVVDAIEERHTTRAENPAQEDVYIRLKSIAQQINELQQDYELTGLYSFLKQLDALLIWDGKKYIPNHPHILKFLQPTEARSRIVRNQKRTKAAMLRDQGLTLQQIADELAVDKSSVSRWLRTSQ